MTGIRISEMPDPEVMTELGQRLRGLRDAAGLNQTEAAERAGLDRSTVSRAEQGDNPTLLTLIRLLRVYGRMDALETFIPVAEVRPMVVIGRQRVGDRSPGKTRDHDPVPKPGDDGRRDG